LDIPTPPTAQQIWEYATRTITSGGVTAQQVWEYATRTLTAGSGISAQEVWEYTTRALTDKAGFAPTAQQVWEYAARTITDKTGFALSVTPPTSAEIADAIWDEIITGHVTPNSAAVALSAGGVDIADLITSFSTVMNRLLEQKVEGSITTVNPVEIDAITLYQHNDYPEFELTLNPQWSTYLDGSYEVYFYIKETLGAVTPIVSKVGTIISQAECTVQFPLTVTNLDVNWGEYVWQVVLWKPDTLPTDPPLSVKVAGFGKVYIRPTFKALPEPVV
jgi:hypothetical protein